MGVCMRGKKNKKILMGWSEAVWVWWGVMEERRWGKRSGVRGVGRLAGGGSQACACSPATSQAKAAPFINHDSRQGTGRHQSHLRLEDGGCLQEGGVGSVLWGEGHGGGEAAGKVMGGRKEGQP